MCIERKVRGSDAGKRRDLQITGRVETASSGIFRAESAKFTHMISAGVVVVMMCGDASDDFDTEPLGR